MALRKLQAEIDKTLKTVSQGVEAFDSTFEKLNHASNSTQKDKLENDLKTQIKKLQRMRDQIKVWLGSSDIKDKSALLDNRKLIETQMERFKALEKEMKMKAFSKEGLIAQSRLDPAEKAKREMIDWIGNTTDELSRQIEATEAEAETLQTGKKKNKAAGDKLHGLEELNERRQWHIGRLEVVQRMLENGQLNTDQVEVIQEDVKYFVESNSEEDFDYDTGIYDELNLQEEEDYLQGDFSHNDDLSNLDSVSVLDSADVPKTPAKEEKERKSTPAKQAPPSTTDETPPSPVLSKKTISRKTTLDSTKAEPVKLPAKSAEAAPPVPPLPAAAATAPTPKATALPPIRYAAAAAAAVAPAASSSSLPTVPAPAASSATVMSPEPATPAKPVESHAAVESAPVLETQKSPSPHTASPAAFTSALQAESSASPPAAAPAPAQTNGHAPPPPPGIPVARSPAPGQSAPSQSVLSPSTNGIPLQAYPQQGESSRAASAISAPSPAQQQGVMGNLMQSFDMAKELSQQRANDVNELHSALDQSFANVPHQTDAEPPRYYHPQNPIRTPSYYPQTRLPVFDDKTHISRLDQDVLFYIFYYMTGTYEQWLAAQELKAQSWRFHKQYLTWFQRAYNPQAITEDYEQGGYVYFDWENSWCQRKKSDFRFEYRWLSDH